MTRYQRALLVDGAPNAMKFYGKQADVYRQGRIQDFQAMTCGFAPEFGNASEAILNAVTRSSTNNIPGLVYTATLFAEVFNLADTDNFSSRQGSI